MHGSCATFIELSLRQHVPADAAPLYEHSCQTLGWTADADRMSSMRKANEEQMSKLEASIKDAEENLGDIEVRDAFLAKADYLYKIGAHSSDPQPVKNSAETYTLRCPACAQGSCYSAHGACLPWAWHGMARHGTEICMPLWVPLSLIAGVTSASGIGDQTAAKDAYTTTEQKTAGVGQKMDLAFSMLRSVVGSLQAQQRTSHMC